MPQDNATYRSFAPLRMTNDAIPVILSAAKDLYESSRDYILQIPQLSVKNRKERVPLALPVQRNRMPGARAGLNTIPQFRDEPGL